MRYADWLKFRGDMWLMACLFLLWQGAWQLAAVASAMFVWRNAQAARITAGSIDTNRERQERRGP